MAVMLAFGVTVVATPLAAAVARRLGIVDRPGELKIQSTPVPYLGGIAVLAGVSAPTLTERPSLLLPLALAAALGAADDMRELNPYVRLASQLAIGVFVAVTVDVAGPFAVVCVVVTVALINAVNLLDGLDGLASGTTLVSAIGFAVLTSAAAATLSLALAGALAGFLVWNRPPAHIYLGDAGSYAIGTALAALSASAVADQGNARVVCATALLVGVPVADVTVAIVRRWRAKRPLFVGDRGHVYDQLVDRSWTSGTATLACVAAQGVLLLVALSVANLNDGVAVAITVAVVTVIGVWALHTFTSPASWAD